MTLIEYSSEFSDMAEADKLYQSYDLQQNDWMTPDIVSSFGGHWMIWCVCCWMKILLVAVCWCKVDGYKIYNLLNKNQTESHKL